MMPVPTHLRNCVVPKEDKIDESALNATVKCTCGSEGFLLLYPGQTQEYDGQQFPCTAEIDGSFFFVIKVACLSCQKEYLLLDKDFHGWDGFVCHDEGQASKPRPALVPWECLSCGGASHRAYIGIQTEGREDFVESVGDEFDADRWVDGFGWFSMGIICNDCGKESPEWADYETM